VRVRIGRIWVARRVARCSTGHVHFVVSRYARHVNTVDRFHHGDAARDIGALIAAEQPHGERFATYERAAGDVPDAGHVGANVDR
jgi:hypothetical protein